MWIDWNTFEIPAEWMFSTTWHIQSSCRTYVSRNMTSKCLSFACPACKKSKTRNRYSTTATLIALIVLRRLTSPSRWTGLVNHFQKAPIPPYLNISARTSALLQHKRPSPHRASGYSFFSKTEHKDSRNAFIRSEQRWNTELALWIIPFL